MTSALEPNVSDVTLQALGQFENRLECCLVAGLVVFGQDKGLAEPASIWISPGACELRPDRFVFGIGKCANDQADKQRVELVRGQLVEPPP